MAVPSAQRAGARREPLPVAALLRLDQRAAEELRGDAVGTDGGADRGAGDLSPVLVLALQLAERLREELRERRAGQLQEQPTLRWQVGTWVGVGVQPPAGPVVDLGEVVHHALAGDVRTAQLGFRRPPQERRRRLRAQPAEDAA